MSDKVTRVVETPYTAQEIFDIVTPTQKPHLPYQAKEVYDMGSGARRSRQEEMLEGQQRAIDLLFEKVIIPYTKDGKTEVEFTWAGGNGPFTTVVEYFTRDELRLTLEPGGFQVSSRKESADAGFSTVTISWYQ